MKMKPYSTDVFMLNLWKHLVRDFRSVEGPEYCVREEQSLCNSIREFRALKWPARSQAPVYLFKQQVQLENLFKRYRFKDDAYTDKELDERTFTKFREHQCELKDTNENVSLSTYLVVQRARLLVKEILGQYDPEEHVDACRFGIKANLGVPAAKAYLDVKLNTLSGSTEHCAWFEKHVVAGDPLLRAGLGVDWFLGLSPKLPDTYVCGNEQSLKMVNVAKSWKIKRGIIPDTVLGSFYTNGLGTVITQRLRTHGLNIRKLQKKHRALAQRFSRSRSHVTADLSNASNSFTWSLVCRLVPRKWLKALDLGRARRYSFDEGDYLNVSFMMMGIGFTFPLQTLLFYALIRAVEDLLGERRQRHVSVYGDDLIYPRAYHKFVVKVFADLGFTMNKDKTYVQDNFRESCGGDYFHGADVRPFQPEAEYQVLYRKPYILFLYKTLNGLLSRWTEFDIPQTVRFVLLEILRVETKIVLVPSSYPDFSGLHSNLVDLAKYWPVVNTKLNTNTWLTDVWRYEVVGRDRIILNIRPYYWLQLRTIALQGERKPLSILPKSSLRLVELKPQPKNYRSRVTGRRLKCCEWAEAEKLVSGTIVYQKNN